MFRYRLLHQPLEDPAPPSSSFPLIYRKDSKSLLEGSETFSSEKVSDVPRSPSPVLPVLLDVVKLHAVLANPDGVALLGAQLPEAVDDPGGP